MGGHAGARRDTSIGISAGHLDKFFELFGQAPASLDRSQGGLGVGLTLVRLIAELHGGRAQVFRDGLGQGTEAVMHLPLHSQRAATGSFVLEHVPRAIPPERVLVIDDSVDVADMLAEYLQQIGHEVIQAHDGRTGLDAAMRHQPDAIVCDIGVPGLHGLPGRPKIARGASLRSSLLIGVSGYDESADRDKARAAGFAHHVTKSADPVALADLIANNGKYESESRPAPVTRPTPSTGKS